MDGELCRKLAVICQKSLLSLLYKAKWGMGCHREEFQRIFCMKDTACFFWNV